MPHWKSALCEGQVIPACPLALHEDGTWSPRHQRALIRYYHAAGAGGLAVGVHTTQFEIRQPEHNLLKPVLQLAAETLREIADDAFVRVAGICGPTPQAQQEATLARDLGYHCGLVSLSALKEADDDALIEHCERVSEILPVFGFYLQPAVGGRLLSYRFWRRFCDIENVVAIKIAAFNRYQTWDVVRAVIESGREEISLYTGNDDNIIVDLLTEFRHENRSRRIVGGLLGQWAVWTKAAVDMLRQIKNDRQSDQLSAEWLSRNVALTDINGVLFDAAHSFEGCIPGINEVLRRNGLLPSGRCLNPAEVLSPGQSDEISRVTAAYPEFTDDDFIRSHVAEWLNGD
ncbi:MAG: dihydrodipicolinate synthase family protein [Planctomycetaceae bacterium]|nr:dihydrodipicolinate synthase family protein [Planctomycetaceae bacterium]